MAEFETEVKFELPRGYIDEKGEIHKVGIMRLANAADEIVPMNDQRVKANPGYLSVLLLSRVIIRLGRLEKVEPAVIEKLFTADMAYLQDLYQKINSVDPPPIVVVCPKCSFKFAAENSFFGEA